MSGEYRRGMAPAVETGVGDAGCRKSLAYGNTRRNGRTSTRAYTPAAT